MYVKKSNLEITVQIKLILFGIGIQVQMCHHTGPLILANTLLEEVGFAL